MGPRVIDDINKACKAFKKMSNDCSYLLKKYSLSKFMDRPVARLSEGEIRLVSLLSVVALGTRVILMDEPTVGLDKIYRDKLLEVLRNECKDRVIVVATNDMRFASHADKVILLEKGNVIFSGDPRIAFYKISRKWLYSPIVDFVNRINSYWELDHKPITTRELVNLLKVLLNES